MCAPKDSAGELSSGCPASPCVLIWDRAEKGGGIYWLSPTCLFLPWKLPGNATRLSKNFERFAYGRACGLCYWLDCRSAKAHMVCSSWEAASRGSSARTNYAWPWLLATNLAWQWRIGLCTGQQNDTTR